ncbi:unnamed protein product [Ostreobium quekettii]|uniref:Uncharacterized protein n=1 Tax=Ostreobium quekettii TaxID=121088 RepID=A0A8S1ITU8_9CHLO|nr:unnamed protein product [Ostreobium quekettii]
MPPASLREESEDSAGCGDAIADLKLGEVSTGDGSPVGGGGGAGEGSGTGGSWEAREDGGAESNSLGSNAPPDASHGVSPAGGGGREGAAVRDDLPNLCQGRWRGALRLASLEGDGADSPVIEGFLDSCDSGATPRSSWGLESDRGPPSCRPPRMSALAGERARAWGARGAPHTPRCDNPPLIGSSPSCRDHLANGGPSSRLGDGHGIGHGRLQRASAETGTAAGARGIAGVEGSTVASPALASSPWSTVDVPAALRRSTSGPGGRAGDGELQFDDAAGRLAGMEGASPGASGSWGPGGGPLRSGSVVRAELVTTDSGCLTPAGPERPLSIRRGSSMRDVFASHESFLHFDVEELDELLSPSLVPGDGGWGEMGAGNPPANSVEGRTDAEDAREGSGGTLCERYKSLVAKTAERPMLVLNLGGVARADAMGSGELDSARNNRSREAQAGRGSEESLEATAGAGGAPRSRLREDRRARARSDPAVLSKDGRGLRGRQQRGDSAVDTAFAGWSKTGEQEDKGQDDEGYNPVSWPGNGVNVYPLESKYANPLSDGWQPNWVVQYTQNPQFKVYDPSFGLPPVRSIHRKSISVSGTLPEGSVVGSEMGLFSKEKSSRGGRMCRLLGRLFWCRCPGGKKAATTGGDETVSNSIFYDGADEDEAKRASARFAGYARRQKFIMRMIEESRQLD